MPFLQLTLESDSIDPDALEAACFAAGALSVTLMDAADTPILEPAPDATPLWPKVKFSILFAAEANRARVLGALAAITGDTLSQSSFTEIADRAWEREWLVHFKPMRFGRNLWICPHGQQVAAADATIVHLDPGLAFGTGTHPTTALCLEWLDGAALQDKDVLDYGCGSGILALAAVKLGARHVYAVDHDPQALLATRDNAVRNDVARQIETLPPETVMPRADVLLANILALPLIELAPRFQTAVHPGGHVVLSGILSEQADVVAAAYTPWFEMDRPEMREDWVRLHGVRRRASNSSPK